MMRLLAFCFLMVIGFSSSAQIPTTGNLMPYPKSMIFSEGRFKMSPSFSVAITADQKDTAAMLAGNAMYQTLNKRTGLFFNREFISFNSKNDTAALQIRIKQKAHVEIGVDESYKLQVNNRQLVLEANNTIGALRGMQTVIQLLSIDASGFYFPAVQIEDAPRFAWRGLMIDVARHFIPIDVLYRNVDAMAAVKMNVLHLHLSDDQGFRVESKIYPRLQGEGSMGEFYTQAQLRDLINYASAKGILIVPEFDMPGHNTSWFAGYPELATKPGPYRPGPPYKLDRSKPQTLPSVMQTLQTSPIPSFNPTNEVVYTFLDRFIGEMAMLFPAAYFHIGADENNGVAWKQDSAIVGFMRKHNLANTHELQAYFVSRVQTLVAKHGKKMIGWDELFSKNLSKEVAVQVWSPMSAPGLVQEISDRGNPVILSKGYYLDHFYPSYIHYKLELPAGKILGGEAAQWTEIADAENIETRMWPRASAIAEKFWSPVPVNDELDLYRRLYVTSDRLSEGGLLHISNYDRMVLRFSAGYNLQDTKTLMDVLTPIKGYKRLFALFNLPPSAAYQTAPLVRAADIAWVDPETKWIFRKNVSEFLQTKNPSAEAAVRDQLNRWKENDKQLQPLFESSSLAKEIQQHSKNLSALAELCLQSMDMQSGAKQPSEEWSKNSKALLDSAKGSYGDVELAVYPEMQALIAGQLKPLPVSYPLF